MSRLVIALAGAALALGCARSTGALDLVDVQRDDLVVAVEVSGVLAAVDSTDIKPPAIPDGSMFKIRALADEGSAVAAGAPIVTFDSSDLDRMAEQVTSQIAEASSRLAQLRAQGELSRGEDALKLVELDATAQKAQLVLDVPADLVAAGKRRDDQLDHQQTTAERALAGQQAAYAQRTRDAELQGVVDTRAGLVRQLDQLQHSLARLAIASPRAGTVVYPGGQNGATEKRKVGDSVYVSEVVVQVVGLDAMLGNGEVDEVELAGLAVNEPVALRLDARPDVELHGTLQAIAPSVQAKSSDDPSNIVRVTIGIAAAPAAGLRPGMRFRGRIETQRIPGVVQVPAEAVFVTADGPVVFRAAGGGAERVPVVLGHRSADRIEVQHGLSPGDRVSRVDPEQGAR